MLQHPHIDPVAISLGHWHLFGQDYAPAIHWYGLTYMVAFGLFVWLAGKRAQYPWFAREGWVRRDVEDLLFYGVLGVVLGGRLGYVIFYKPLYYLDHLREIVAVWNGGMSFHGGMLGVLVAMAFFAWQRQRPFLQVTDLIAPCVPLGLASGRIGNFINGELWGKPTDVPWAFGVAAEPGGQLIGRHPSQLYEAALEGLAMFVVLWWFASRPRPRGAILGLALLWYGCARFALEFVRLPDAHIGYLAFGWVTEGQVLSLPMILAGLFLLWRAYGAGRPLPA